MAHTQGNQHQWWSCQMHGNLRTDNSGTCSLGHMNDLLIVE